MKWYLNVLQNYANFSGRASRKEYWYFVLFNLIFGYALLFLGATMFRTEMLYYVYVLATLIPGFAVAVRRMHDVNKSGWFCLIPFYNLVLACTEGTHGRNDYGPDPYATEPEFDFDKEPATN